MNKRRLGAGAATLAILALAAGCGPRPEGPTAATARGEATVATTTAATASATAAPDLDAEIARAAGLGRPLLVLVAEPRKGGADESARGLLDPSTLGSDADGVVSVLLDLGVSRNRATAARFHVLETPVLFCLSPRGLIVARDEAPLSKDLVLRRIRELGPRARELDAQFAALEGSALNDDDPKPRLALADFLQGRQNMREAIPHLAAVARSPRTEAAPRIRAWVDLARAHLWIAEPEKGRHEAEALIAEWGPRIPEARAGGNLVLATQDAKAKRTARARREFEEAIAAAPDSDYARQAKEGLAALPKEGP